MSPKLLPWLAAVSGVLSFGALYLPGKEELARDWAAGAIYGCLVLVPSSRSLRQGALLVSASVVVYRSAVWLAISLFDDGWSGLTSCTVAGVAGAIALGGATLACLRVPPTLGRLAQFAGSGAVGGLLIGANFPLADASLPGDPAVLAGYVGWQVLFTLVARPILPAA
jgi:hypothetical protein